MKLGLHSRSWEQQGLQWWWEDSAFPWSGRCSAPKKRKVPWAGEGRTVLGSCEGPMGTCYALPEVSLCLKLGATLRCECAPEMVLAIEPSCRRQSIWQERGSRQARQGLSPAWQALLLKAALLPAADLHPPCLWRPLPTSSIYS